ncbi:hypothetical protein N9O16_04940 [Candidatus Poseidoniaceae archaeon]|nr:hypothetical protein [Euryarchaeota archaeon]MDA9166820.1 hypothetical protein [Candidatus Poseidoniaceae archaeon]MDC3236694.1 hypothetical protein [Candidatus Poseidoniaceae archaeon]
MTTQGTTITVGNPMMSKVFSKSATDGQWSGNVLTDTIAGQSLGILIPNSTLTIAQAEYESGCMAYRIQNAQTLAVKTRGFGVKTGQNCMTESSITAMRVDPNDILTVFPQPLNAGANTSNVLAWVTTTKGTELMTSSPTDSTATALKTAINEQTLGDAFFNSTLREVRVQVEDGARLINVQVIDEMGGVVKTLQGGYRGATGGARSNSYNLYAVGLGINIGKGWSLKVTTLAA